MIDIVVFKGPREQAQGLIGMKPIPDRTLFMFPGIRAGALFHSQGVLEPFDIAFVDRNGKTLKFKRVIPPHGIAIAPPGTDRVVETKAGAFVKLAAEGAPIQFADLGNISRTDLLCSGVMLLAGIGLGYYGYSQHKGPARVILLGAAGSVAAVAFTELFKNGFYRDNT